MNDQINRPLWAFVLISLLIHWAFMFTPFLDHFTPTSFETAAPKTFEIVPVEESWLKKLRTVGTKDGRKEFSEKIENQRQLSLAQLAATQKSPPPIVKTNTNPSPVSINQENELATAMSIIKNNSQAKERRQDINRMVLKDISANPENNRAIKNTGFDVVFEPPEGVSEDELNAMEKVFYSFQKRAFESYMHAFIDAYHKVALSRPGLNKDLPRDKQVLTGKITFDKNGDVVALKVLRWSNDDDIQKLFDETLLNIRRLPNPPRALLEKREEFSVHYQLYIN